MRTVPSTYVTCERISSAGSLTGLGARRLDDQAADIPDRHPVPLGGPD
jgi:hypothetical protein